ncbi:LD-carboxypeptidase [Burkholderia cenocepacia]|uniref:LD-carboxypeptidase n=1 Tax=Burkholderia cepacia complex TaxID=87882 RepID=UPI001B9E3D57|nr:LD-carboxypeptidase [Burkholderia orbicola]MBR8041989.1 LD-carboxypeptidase [Burkholderia cenocepacia]MBR8324399.1 LD-carboxypeptidase [Burkholderia cenocepacia]MBR8374822.1 LD-carboxypeptidase [Burkholderia cenocepacia]MDN7578658.1 LD-carboxypeptidase [Burkholderia orbicola]MDN7578929.1 LD-carboxypeptidase [Burkholderia orbicola]
MIEQGKRVAVVAPAGIPDRDNLARAVSLLESWGFFVSVGAHVTDRFRYLAGSHQDRIDDLLAALSDPAVDIVWIARGGYGSTHVLPALPTTVPRKKTVIGFSDATALFCALKQIPGIDVIHGPTLNGLATKVDEESRLSVLGALTGVSPTPLPLERLHGPADPIGGPLVGGNLTVLASMAGSRWEPRFRDSIVVLEDVTELAYRIDRSIMTMRHAGILDGARAIVLGDFVRCSLPAGANYLLTDALLDVLAPLGAPIYGGLPVGHGQRNLSWVIGRPAEIRGGILFR